MFVVPRLFGPAFFTSEAPVPPAQAQASAWDRQPEVFHFEDEQLQEEEEGEVPLPSLTDAWEPVGSTARKVHEQVVSLGPGAAAADVAMALADAGYHVVLRRGLGAVRAPEKAASMLRNQFIVINKPASGNTTAYEELLIEMQFRSHFELAAGGSSRYFALLSQFPDVFVGTLRELTALVRIAASHLAHEYKCQARDVPPWRTASALLSLWAPEVSQDIIPGGATTATLGHETSLGSDGSAWGSSPDVSPVGSPVSVLRFGEPTAPLQKVALRSQPAVVYGFDVPAPNAPPAIQPVAASSTNLLPEMLSVHAHLAQATGAGRNVHPRFSLHSTAHALRKVPSTKLDDLLPAAYTVQMDQRWLRQGPAGSKTTAAVLVQA